MGWTGHAPQRIRLVLLGNRVLELGIHEPIHFSQVGLGPTREYIAEVRQRCEHDVQQSLPLDPLADGSQRRLGDREPFVECDVCKSRGSPSFKLDMVLGPRDTLGPE